jgi:hypothetical protein
MNRGGSPALIYTAIHASGWTLIVMHAAAESAWALVLLESRRG